MNNLTGCVGGIQKYSTSDGPGIRTTVFLKGCPLKCRWCHNPELIKFEKQILFTAQKCIGCMHCQNECPIQGLKHFGETIEIPEDKCLKCFHCADRCYSEAIRIAGEDKTVEEVMAVVKQDKGYYKRTGGGMTISGGEMMSQADFAEALLDAAKEEDITVALDTCGFANGDRLFKMAKKADVILYDIKSIDDEVHKKATGVSNEIILNNLARLADDEEINSKIWIRMPLIKGINDKEEIIDATIEFLDKHNLRYVTAFPYHELGISKYKSLRQDYENFEAPDSEWLAEIKRRMNAKNIKMDILGEEVQ